MSRVRVPLPAFDPRSFGPAGYGGSGAKRARCRSLRSMYAIHARGSESANGFQAVRLCQPSARCAADFVESHSPRLDSIDARHGRDVPYCRAVAWPSPSRRPLAARRLADMPDGAGEVTLKMEDQKGERKVKESSRHGNRRSRRRRRACRRHDSTSGSSWNS
jgi:hypothetical protein